MPAVNSETKIFLKKCGVDTTAGLVLKKFFMIILVRIKEITFTIHTYLLLFPPHDLIPSGKLSSIGKILKKPRYR